MRGISGAADLSGGVMTFGPLHICLLRVHRAPRHTTSGAYYERNSNVTCTNQTPSR